MVWRTVLLFCFICVQTVQGCAQDRFVKKNCSLFKESQNSIASGSKILIFVFVKLILSCVQSYCSLHTRHKAAADEIQAHNLISGFDIPRT